MNKTTLLVIIGAAVLAVGAIGAITATVIVNGDNDGGRVVQAAPIPVPARPSEPFGQRGERRFGLGRPGRSPGMPGMDKLRACLQQQGLDGSVAPGTAPDLQKLRDALKACRAALPRLQPQP